MKLEDDGGGKGGDGVTIMITTPFTSPKYSSGVLDLVTHVFLREKAYPKTKYVDKEEENT